MKVVSPIITTDAILTSSTISEPDSDETEWTAGTYNLGDVRIQRDTHRKYKVVSDPSTTAEPKVGVLTAPKSWADIGPTNAWAMFDDVNGTQSTTTSPFTTQLTPAQLYNSLSGFNITGAASISVRMTDPTAGVVYTKTIAMQDNTNVVGMYSWLFTPIVNITRFVLLDLPPYPNAVLKIDIEPIATLGIGTVVYGTQTDLGTTIMDVSDQGLDFSVRDIDEFGNFKITRRRTADLINFDCFAKRDNYNYVKTQLKRLSSVPTVWIGNEGDVNDGTAVYGYYSDRQINIQNPSTITFTITVQGLV